MRVAASVCLLSSSPVSVCPLLKASPRRRIPALSNKSYRERFVAALLPEKETAVWTEACIELGATICLPRSPACAACPVRPWCLAAAESQQTVSRRAHCSSCQICVEGDSPIEWLTVAAALQEGDIWSRYPLRVSSSKKKRQLQMLSLFALSGDSQGPLRVLLQQRGPEGLLARQWGPLTVPWEGPPAEATAATLTAVKSKAAKRFLTHHLKDLLLSEASLRYLETVSHQFTHQSHAMHVFTTRLSEQQQQQQQQEQQQQQLQRCWVTLEEAKATLTCSYFVKQLDVLQRHLKSCKNTYGVAEAPDELQRHFSL
ncbi:hypothetical protein Efla_001159 [Eimeria flavescens]